MQQLTSKRITSLNFLVKHGIRNGKGKLAHTVGIIFFNFYHINGMIVATITCVINKNQITRF